MKCCIVDAKEQKEVEKFCHVFQNDTKQQCNRTLGYLYFWILIIMLQAVQKACKMAKLPCFTQTIGASYPLDRNPRANLVRPPQESQDFFHFHWVLKVSWFLPLLWLWLLVLVLLLMFLHVHLALHLNNHQYFLVLVLSFPQWHQIHQLFRRKKEKIRLQKYLLSISF